MPLSVAIAVSGQIRTFPENARDLDAMFRRAAGEGAELCYFGALHHEDRSWASDALWTSVTVHTMQRVAGMDGAPVGHPRITDNPAQAVWQQWQGILAVGQLVRFVERLRGRAFDWVIRCRPDLTIERPIERLADCAADAVYVPGHDNWGGLNDRFAFGPSALMAHYFEYPNSVAKCVFAPGARRVAPEHILARHLREAGVKIRRTTAVLSLNRGSGVKVLPTYRADRGDVR